jgi:hypothetical protein
MKILGIDPGKDGWWCILDSDKKMGFAKKFQWSDDGILDISLIPKCDRCYIEKVHAIPGKMGVKSAFSFGVTFGQIRWATHRLSCTLITPQSWQGLCLEGIDTQLENKMRSRAGFARINPEFKFIKNMNHNFTDAFHIANYGLLLCGINLGDWDLLNKDEIFPQYRK